MVRYVYVDVLFFVNWLMNYLILWATASFTENTAGAGNLLLASGAGALYSVLVAVYPESAFGHPLYKLVVLVLMVAIGFRPRNTAAGLRIVAHFLTFCFCVAGAAMALAYLAGASMDGPGWGLVVGGALVASLGVAGVVARAKRRRAFPEMVATEIRVGDRVARFSAFVDTGNHLRDPVSGWPVVVAEKGAVECLMPADVKQAFGKASSGPHPDLSTLELTSWATRLRIIPFDSLGRSGGMLLGFRPDAVTFSSGARKTSTSRAVVGVYGRRISGDGAYRALIGPELAGLTAEER